MGRKPKAVDAAPPLADGAAGEGTADVGAQARTRKPSVPRPRPQYNQKRRRRCDCGTAEACFACRRCMEQHCTCGDAGRAAVATLCRESSACNCRVAAGGASRCVLCMGCRQSIENQSHCRCTLHQEFMRRSAAEEKKWTEADKMPCRCFELAAVEPEQQQRRRKRLALVGRRAGVPSSHGLYAKKVPGALGDFAESDVDSDWDESGDGVASDMFPVARSSVEELEDTLSVARILDSKPRSDVRTPQQPLEWSGTKPFQASIGHTPEAISAYNRVLPKAERDEINRRTMPLQLDRAIDNALFVQDQARAMPSEEMVEYLIVASSVKAAHMPELIGSLDNTAATAVGIVVEEYMRQLVIRSDRQSLCQKTKEAVRDFASMVLRDFNYQLFLRKLNYPPLSRLTAEESEDVRKQLVQLVFTEFRATQRSVDRGGFVASAQEEALCEAIREVAAMELAATVEQASGGQASALAVEASVPAEKQSVKAVKVTQRTSKLTGQPIYKFDVAARVGDKHVAKVTLDGFESIPQVQRSIVGIRKAMEKQNQRISKIEHPSPVREVDDPIVAELYQQLVNQVKASQVANNSSTPSSVAKTTPAAPKGTASPDKGASRSASRRVTRQSTSPTSSM